LAPETAKEIGGFRRQQTSQVNTSMFDNGLRMQGGFPYNPKVLRNNGFPAEIFRE